MFQSTHRSWEFSYSIAPATRVAQRCLVSTEHIADNAISKHGRACIRQAESERDNEPLSIVGRLDRDACQHRKARTFKPSRTQSIGDHRRKQSAFVESLTRFDDGR